MTAVVVAGAAYLAVAVAAVVAISRALRCGTTPCPAAPLSDAEVERRWNELVGGLR